MNNIFNLNGIDGHHMTDPMMMGVGGNIIFILFILLLIGLVILVYVGIFKLLKEK